MYGLILPNTSKVAPHGKHWNETLYRSDCCCVSMGSEQIRDSSASVQETMNKGTMSSCMFGVGFCIKSSSAMLLTMLPMRRFVFGRPRFGERQPLPAHRTPSNSALGAKI